MLERSLTMVGEGQKAMCMAMVGVLSGEKSLEEARGAERALEDRMGMLRDVDSMVAMAIDR